MPIEGQGTGTTPRFDEIELRPEPQPFAGDPEPAGFDVAIEPELPPEVLAGAIETDDGLLHAARLRRAGALVTDASLFVAIALALTPFLPHRESLAEALRQQPWPFAALAGFLVMLSYFYFAGAWLIWGRSVGNAIFDVRIVGASGEGVSLRQASLRWAGMFASAATGGLGFLLALLPSRLSLADRLSSTRSAAEP
jgi:uncharacterized RDD family membrane protein YckC